jgi:hypothetical protein
VIVFDGGNPYRCITQVLAGQRQAACLWVRRGMWQKNQDNTAVIAKEKLFDAVIEPGDLAESRDEGATASRRDGVFATSPIRLVDEAEQLPRAEARAELGLQPDVPAVLIQLGVGNRRDVSSILERIVSGFPADVDVQLVQLVSPISCIQPRYLNRLSSISAYPMARYLKSFDFAISAAGYNSFHELLAAHIPTLFVAAMTPDLDDQAARASYAEAKGAAYALSADNLAEAPDRLRRLLDANLRFAMEQNCSRLQVSNGAAQAAEIVAEFAL